MRQEETTIPKSNRRSIQLLADQEDPHVTIQPKKEPPSFAAESSRQPSSEHEEFCEKLLALWKSVRLLSSADQIHPRFVGWVVALFQQANSKKTSETYLPPISTPITEYSTIVKLFQVSRELSRQSNMSYAHITLDVGAAIKAYHVIWNNPVLWSDIIIHLGDFHAMMAFFGVIGLLVSGSGFEEVLFQAGLCSSGSITGVISGKHYNRCWLAHEAFSEALERLFQERFLPSVPENVADFAQCPPGTSNVQEILDDENVTKHVVSYETQRQKCLNGDFGKTPQFWALYMKLIDRQQKLHFAVNNNDYDLRLLIWKRSLPLCFSTNRVHYSRYGTYYVKSLECLESTHPGAREEIAEVGLSVRRNTLAIGQAVDLAGEQSYMRTAKTAGT